MMINELIEILLLMVMEMRMSDWTELVEVILVYFKFQVPSVLFCVFLYEMKFR